jgi:hypothetical protein
MTEKEVMKFVIERSNDPIIKNPVLREAMNKDLGPRPMFGQGSSVDSAVRTVDPVQDSGNKIEEVLKAYELYIKNRSGKRPMKFKTFFEEYGKENFATGGQAGQLVSNTVDGSRPGYSGQPKKYDPKKVLEAIENSNSKIKYNTLDMLAKELDGVAGSSHLHAIIKREKFPKLDSYANKAERAFLELFDEVTNKTPQQLKNPLHKIADMMGLSENTKNTTTSNRGPRVENISKALKESKLFNYAKDVKPVIDKLSNVNFIKKLDRASANKNPWTMDQINFNIDNPISLSPQGDAERLMQYVIRHKDQAGKKATFTLIDNITGQNIKDTSRIDRYLDVSFKDPKDPSGKIYDMDYLERNAVNDPMFKEYFDVQNKLKDMKERTTWPDGSLIIDRTGKNVTFKMYAAEMYKHGYGYKDPYQRFPYQLDHSDLKKHPFKNLQVLPTRINVATGAADKWNKPDIKKKMGTEYFRNLSIDDLMMKEKALGEKILIFDQEGDHVGKTFKNIKNDTPNAWRGTTPYKAAKIKADNLEQGLDSKFAQRMMAFCPAGSKRVKKAGGGGAGPTCSMEQAQAGLKKQADAATKASKNGKIPKKFGKLRSFLTFAFGVADPLIETLLVLPELFAGNPDAAIQSSSLGWFTDKGKFDLEKLKDTNPKAYQYLKDIRATKEYNEAVNTLDELEPFLAKAEAEGTLDQVNPEFLEQYRNAKKRYVSIPEEYEEYGYVEGGSDTPLTARVEFQQYLRDKVKSDYEKGRRRVDINNMTTQELKDLTNFKYLKKDPNTKYEDIYTAPTDLKSFIDQKGELGKDTMLQYGVRNEAERIGDEGVYDIFDTYAGGYAGVETPGELNIYKDLKTVPPSMGFKEDGFSVKKPGIKDVRDAYAELPKDYAGQLAALEKEELIQGLKRKGMFNTRRFKDLLESQQMDTDELYAQGGLANLMKKYND